jgi:general secretion pathway protein I
VRRGGKTKGDRPLCPRAAAGEKSAVRILGQSSLSPFASLSPCSRRRGFTLLEVLVATTIMAIAVGTLMSALSTSLRNASRVTERDRAALVARRVLDDMMVQAALPYGQVMQGRLDPIQTGMEGGWRAMAEPFETGPAGLAGDRLVERIAVEVYWRSGVSPRSLRLEGYRGIRRLPGGQQ